MTLKGFGNLADVLIIDIGVEFFEQLEHGSGHGRHNGSQLGKMEGIALNYMTDIAGVGFGDMLCSNEFCDAWTFSFVMSLGHSLLSFGTMARKTHDQLYHTGCI
jgi:hypothetical protein